ncbi:MAG: glutamate racemase [Desulfobacula sp.]|nr:glutamate racemase [Desulfobacula sp.]
MQNTPIGIFDSGVGGLSVLKEIRKSLPNESIVYFADSANCPYGSKVEAQAQALAREKIEFLLEQGCKLIVIACNTVTAVAIDEFRSVFGVPFIGMEPALKPATFQTKTGKIGVLATENTFNGRLFKQTLEKYANGVEVFVQPGFGLVELVEKGEHKSKKARRLLEKYLLPMIEQGVDTLVLGCTHYPFLKEMIEKIAPQPIAVIDPSSAVAAQTKRILCEFNLCSEQNNPTFSFYTTGEKINADRILSQTMNHPYHLKQIKR